MARTETRGPDLYTQFFDRLTTRPGDIVGKAAQLFALHDPNSYLPQFHAAIDAGKMPVIIANHQSLSDGIALSVVTSKLPKAFRLPMAASIEGGEQGGVVQLLNQYVTPELEGLNIHTIPVVTDRDVEKRAMDRKTNKENFSKLLRSGDDGLGFAMFPEKTVDAGRRKEDGSINGMVPLPQEDAFSSFLRKFVKKGERPVVLPVGIDGSYRVLDPQDNTIPDEVLRMTLGYEKPKQRATVAIGPLMEIDPGRVAELTDDLFMRQISPLLSVAARGAYPSW